MNVIIINPDQIKKYPITMEFDDRGGVDIKVNGWTYIHINYDYRYTDNVTRRLLAERIFKFISGADVSYIEREKPEQAPKSPV